MLITGKTLLFAIVPVMASLIVIYRVETIKYIPGKILNIGGWQMSLNPKSLKLIYQNFL